MPPRKGTTDLHIAIREEVAQQLNVMAAHPGTTKAEIVEAALLTHIAGGASETMLASVQGRLDTLTATLTAELSTLVKIVAALQGEVKNLSTHIAQQDRRYEEVKATVAQLYDTLQANGQRKGMLASIADKLKA